MKKSLTLAVALVLVALGSVSWASTNLNSLRSNIYQLAFGNGVLSSTPPAALPAAFAEEGKGGKLQKQTITICKQTVPTGGTGFPFVRSNSFGALPSFPLNDQQCVTEDLTNQDHFNKFTENVPSGWTLTSISCPHKTSAVAFIGANSHPAFQPGDNTVTIDLNEANVTCTFVNSKAPACCTLPQGLSNWYKFDIANPLKDETGFGNTLTGAPVVVPGKVLQAASFNGTAATVLTAAPPNQPTFGQDFSFDAWIWPNNGTQPFGFGKRTANPLRGWSFFIYNNKLGVQIVDNNSVYHNYFSPGPTIPINTWTFVAVAVHRSHNPPQVEFYVNGMLSTVLITPVAAVVANVNTNTAMKIGGSTINQSDYFNGLLDELELFQMAIDPHDVARIYAAGSAGKCNCPTLNFSYQSRANNSANTSLSLTNNGPGTATNVTVTGIQCTNGFVYSPQNGLLKIPFVVPGAASLLQNATTSFNAFFTPSVNGPFSCTFTYTDGNGCMGTQVVKIP